MVCDFLHMLSNFLLYFKELKRNGKDSEEIRWSKRTLQLLKTLQVPVLDFVIRCQNQVLISVALCQKISYLHC